MEHVRRVGLSHDVVFGKINPRLQELMNMQIELETGRIPRRKHCSTENPSISMV